MHRKLLTKQNFAEWAKKLDFIRSIGFERSEDDFLMLFDFLEEIEIMSPLKVEKRDSEFADQMFLERGTMFVEKPSIEYLNTVDHYYHPFQFFQFILYYIYYKDKTIPKSLFYFYKERHKTEQYFRDEKAKKKRLKEIEKEESKWMKESIKARFKMYNRNVDRSEDRSIEEKKAQKKKNKLDLKKALKNKKDNVNTGLRGINSFIWLSPALLKTWLKLDALLFYREYLITPDSIRVRHQATNCSPHNTRKEEQIIKEFYKWREKKLRAKEEILNEEDIANLKHFIFEIDRIFIRGSTFKMDGLDKWEDLFDLVPVNKMSSFKGATNICLNILSIKRFLIRITWALSNFNLISWPKDQRERQPYFFIKEPKDIIPYRSSVLANYNLYSTIPFTLYVEGRTEWEILSEFVDKKLGFRFNVENMVGADNLPYFKQICDAVPDRIFYFFIDFHNLDEFQSKKDKYGESCSFFFPDFVTENFTVKEFFRAFKLWIAFIKLNVDEQHINNLYILLEKEKSVSNEIIQEYESENQIQRRTTNGYEKVLTNYLQQHFPEELVEKYPQILELDSNNRIKNQEDFSSLVKSEITLRLVKLLRYLMKNDPERKNFKFRFENKLEPFYKEINNYIYRNINLQFDLQSN